MQKFTTLTAGMVLGLASLVAAPVIAGEVRVYPYSNHANYCPTGLQPVSINGVICCGTPNVTMSYQHVIAHPTVKKHKPRRVSARANCPVGTKGCTYD